jgi:hypothetical protein
MVKAIFEFIRDANANGYRDEISDEIIENLLSEVLTVGDSFTDPNLRIGIKKETLSLVRHFKEDKTLRKWAVENLTKLGVDQQEIFEVLSG